MITSKRITVQTDTARLSDCLSSAFTLADNTGISSPTLRPARQKGGKRTCDLEYIQCKNRGGDRHRFLKTYPVRHECRACEEIKDNSERIGMIQKISHHKNISIQSQ